MSVSLNRVIPNVSWDYFSELIEIVLSILHSSVPVVKSSIIDLVIISLNDTHDVGIDFRVAVFKESMKSIWLLNLICSYFFFFWIEVESLAVLQILFDIDEFESVSVCIVEQFLADSKINN
jgi:hypothetical protein